MDHCLAAVKESVHIPGTTFTVNQAAEGQGREGTRGSAPEVEQGELSRVVKGSHQRSKEQLAHI